MSWDDYLALAAAVDVEFEQRRDERVLGFTLRPHLPAGLPVPVRTAYSVWPGTPARTLVCVGGIANTAHRFDFLGADLAGRFRVVALDWAGRGRSGWLPDVDDYGFDTYVDQLQALIEHEADGPVNHRRLVHRRQCRDVSGRPPPRTGRGPRC